MFIHIYMHIYIYKTEIINENEYVYGLVVKLLHLQPQVVVIFSALKRCTVLVENTELLITLQSL